jgi:hypothetical protein
MSYILIYFLMRISSKKYLSSVMVSVFLMTEMLSPMLQIAHAAPAISSTIIVSADGQSPWDATTYAPLTSTNTGTDANGSNGIVRAGQPIDYTIDITINDE